MVLVHIHMQNSCAEDRTVRQSEIDVLKHNILPSEVDDTECVFDVFWKLNRPAT